MKFKLKVFFGENIFPSLKKVCKFCTYHPVQNPSLALAHPGNRSKYAFWRTACQPIRVCIITLPYNEVPYYTVRLVSEKAKYQWRNIKSILIKWRNTKLNLKTKMFSSIWMWNGKSPFVSGQENIFMCNFEADVIAPFNPQFFDQYVHDSDNSKVCFSLEHTTLIIFMLTKICVGSESLK